VSNPGPPQGGPFCFLLDAHCGAWINYVNPANGCSGTATPTGLLINDTPCFTGYHPEIRVNTGSSDDDEAGDASNLAAVTQREGILSQ
jgi:hypothetical protein